MLAPSESARHVLSFFQTWILQPSPLFPCPQPSLEACCFSIGVSFLTISLCFPARNHRASTRSSSLQGAQVRRWNWGQAGPFREISMAPIVSFLSGLDIGTCSGRACYWEISFRLFAGQSKRWESEEDGSHHPAPCGHVMGLGQVFCLGVSTYSNTLFQQPSVGFPLKMVRALLELKRIRA